MFRGIIKYMITYSIVFAGSACSLMYSIIGNALNVVFPKEEETKVIEETTEEITTEAIEVYEDTIKVNIGNDFVVEVPVNQFKSDKEIENGMQYEYKYGGSVKVFEAKANYKSGADVEYKAEKIYKDRKVCIEVIGLSTEYSEKLKEAVSEVLNSVSMKGKEFEILPDSEITVEETAEEKEVEQ